MRHRVAANRNGSRPEKNVCEAPLLFHHRTRLRNLAAQRHQEETEAAPKET